MHEPVCSNLRAFWEIIGEGERCGLWWTWAWERGRMMVALFAAREAALSLVLLIYYFASCGPAQGDEVRETVMRKRACLVRVRASRV